MPEKYKNISDPKFKFKPVSLTVDICLRLN